MDAERLKRIEEIYHAALEIAPAGRDEFFKERCGADENLRREVESLLAFEKTADKLIDRSPESLAAEMFSEEENQASFIGKEIGRYKIRKLLGEGGMGKVFLAEDAELERLVALKILPADFAGREDRVRRFIREAKAISALNHPNILTIFEIGNTGDTRFIATEYIEGETLRERQMREKLDLREILDIAAQTAAALAAAHSAGIIHRDIKPENIMLRRDGFVKILDFGLAKLSTPPSLAGDLDPDALESPTKQLDLTNPGAIMGTTSYMSPEQIRGRADIDARTDIWSLGVVIFEMTTGRVPFTGESMGDVIASILKTDAPHLSKSVSDCPGELDRIVDKCLHKKRDERYQVIKDLALDLKALKRGLEFSAEYDRVTDGAERNLTTEIPKQVTTVENARRFSAGSLLMILLSAGLLLGGVWWFFGGINKVTETPDAASLKTAEIVSWAASPGEFYSTGTFSPDGKMVAFTSTRGGAKNIWIKQTTSGEAIQITKDEFENESPIWSPDGERLAFFSLRGKERNLWQMPKFGGSPKLIGSVEDNSAELKFWSKRDLIYYKSKDNIFAIDANSGQTRQITDLDPNTVNAESISLSFDEKQIAYTTIEDKKWSIWAKNLTGDAPKKLFSSEAEIKNTVWHFDNQRIFYSSPVDGPFQNFVTDVNAAPPKQITFAERDNFVLDVSSEGGKILYGSAKEESDIWGVNLKEAKEFIVASDINSELWAAPAPDGKSIAYQSIKNLSQGNKLSSGAILTKRLNTDEPPTEVVANGFLPVFSPDGQQIAFMQLSGNQYHIETIKAAGGGQKRLTADGAVSVNFSILPYNRLQTSYISWSPDGSKIAYVSSRNGQYNIRLANADGSNDAQLTESADSNLFFHCPLWSPDGKRIAFTSKTRGAKPTYSVLVIDVETKNSKTVTQQQTFYRLISWLPAGNKLVTASIAGYEGSAGAPSEVSLFEVEIESGKTSEIAVLKDAYMANIQMSPDKKAIAFAAHREGKDDLWLIPAAGGAERKLTNNNDSRLYFSSLAWSPDSSSIFFGKQSRYSLLSMLTNFK